MAVTNQDYIVLVGQGKRPNVYSHVHVLWFVQFLRSDDDLMLVDMETRWLS